MRTRPSGRLMLRNADAHVRGAAATVLEPRRAVQLARELPAQILLLPHFVLAAAALRGG